MRYSLAIVLLLIGLSGNAQFEYFELIEGVNGDEISESAVAVELIPGGYATWGLYSVIGPNCAMLETYDLSGNRLDTSAVCSINEFAYVGANSNFVYNPVLSEYYYSAGLMDSTGQVVGYHINFDSNLDTTYAIRYSLFDHTYFRCVKRFGSEIIHLGDYSPPDEGFVGSFMLRTSLTGEVLSSTILHPWQDVSNFSNSYIEKLNDRYYLGGLADEGGDRFGVLSITDEEGILIEEIDYQDDEFEVWSRLGITKLTNDELMVVQTPGYEEYVNDLNLDFYWRTVRLAKIDPITGEEYWSETYLDNYEIFGGRWMDIEATPDGGVAILGIAYSLTDVAIYNYLVKIDAEGNQEFFQTYLVEEGGFAINWLKDLEVAHDGGFIMAGSINNSTVDPYDRSWILKVDACGDMEWQDCQPLSSETSVVKPEVVLYPNPSRGLVFVRGVGTQGCVAQIYDASGQKILETLLDLKTSMIDLSAFPAGVYQVSLRSLIDQSILHQDRIVITK